MEPNYIYEGEVTEKEYIEMSHCFFTYIYFKDVLFLSIIVLACYAVMAILSQSYLASSIVFVSEIFILIYYAIMFNRIMAKRFNKMINKRIMDRCTHIEFHQNYLIKVGEYNSYKIFYYEIKKCIETNTHFYLWFKDRNIVVMIRKEFCDHNLIYFIKKEQYLRFSYKDRTL